MQHRRYRGGIGSSGALKRGVRHHHGHEVLGTPVISAHAAQQYHRMSIHHTKWEAYVYLMMTYRMSHAVSFTLIS